MKFINLVIFLNVLCFFFFATPFSLYGYYTDLVFLILLMVLNVVFIFSKFKMKFLYKMMLRMFLVVTVFTELFFLALFWHLGALKVQDVTSYIIDNTDQKHTIRSAYFNSKSRGCGMGEYWETVTFKYFPVFEYRTFYDRCSHFTADDVKN
jgi:hypothetical protein